MKAYTLRLDDEKMLALKMIALKEKKNLRQILLELIDKKISEYLPKDRKKERKGAVKKALELLQRISVEEIVSSVRKDRKR